MRAVQRHCAVSHAMSHAEEGNGSAEMQKVWLSGMAPGILLGNIRFQYLLQPLDLNLCSADLSTGTGHLGPGF